MLLKPGHFLAYERTSQFSGGSPFHGLFNKQLNEVNFALFTPRFQTDCDSVVIVEHAAHALSQFFEPACSKVVNSYR